MKTLISAAFLLLASAAWGQVLVVNVYDPHPGKAALSFQYAQEARAILKEMGLDSFVASDQMGNLHFGTSFESWAAWGTFEAKLQASSEWAAFGEKLAAEPSAELTDRYMMNQVADGGIGAVYQVFIWDAAAGKTQTTVQNAMGAKPIHEKLGATVGINVDQFGDVHYVLGFDSWEAWGKFQASSQASEEWNAYWASMASEEPSAELAKIYMGQMVP